MKTINLKSSALDLEEKELIKKAFDEFDRGDFVHAYDHFFTIYNQGVNIQGLQLSIGLCCLKLNKRRQSRLFLFREILDYPNNHEAIAILNDQILKINGQTISRDFLQTTRPEKIPEISVVMIVKNEEKDLPRCLESIKNIAKEIIILDTGSTDHTIEIARSFGARVEHFEWCNDFSIARNESLKFATCEWILRLDADEYMEEIDKARLLHCANSGLAEIYLCPMLSPTKLGIQVDINVRLIKNHLGIKFTFPIHESIIFSVKDLGLKQCLTNVKFQHTGYMFDEPGSDEKKTQRNVKVCEDYLVFHPDDYYVRLIRDLFLLNSSINEEALRDFEEVIQKLPDDTLSVRYLGMAYLVLINHYILQKRELDLSKMLLEMQTDFFFDIRMMQYLGEVYLYTKGDWKKANKFFTWSSSRESKTSDFEGNLPSTKYNQKASFRLLAETMVLLKDYDKSRKCYLKVEKMVENLENKQDNGVKTNDESSDEIKINLLNPDELRELSNSQREKSEWFDSYRSTIRAASKSQLTYQDYLNMAYCQIKVKNFGLAHSLLEEAKILEPKSSLVPNFESLILVKENSYAKALEKAVEAFVKEPANQNYQNNVEEIARINELSPVEAIRKVGLNWINSHKTTDGLFALLMYQKFQPDDSEVLKIIQKYSK